VENKYSRFHGERALNDPSPLFKKKEKGGEGQWNVPSLVAIGMFQAWWPMEGERKTHFHLFNFPPTNLLTPLIFFPFNLTVLLYHGPKSLLTPFFPFLRSINYDCALNVTSPSHLHCQFDFD